MTQVRDLTILNAIAEALNSAPDVEQALTRTLALVADLLGLQSGWVWLLDPDTGQMYNAARHNLPPFLQQPVRMAGDTCTCIAEFRDGALTPKNVDVLECSRLRRAVKENAVPETNGLRYHASIPLLFRDRPLGIMNVTGPEWRRLTARELRLLSTIAYQMGVAVDRARLAEQNLRAARAEERARLAREIHDTLAQGLTAIGLHLEGALRQLDASPERARERLLRALSTTRESLEEARRSVLNLRATPLAGKSLPEALAALARTFTSETGVQVRLGVARCRPLPLRTEAELFRIAQEALANARQHARATTVEITLRTSAQRATLSVRDDGEGFAAGAARRGRVQQEREASATAGGARRRAVQATHAASGGASSTWQADQAGRGQGLRGMRERATLLGGTLRVTSAPGRGTTITATVPLGEDGSASRDGASTAAAAGQAEAPPPAGAAGPDLRSSRL